jgi:exopolyphosphatase / guanosine-5'-triphosphate,3'-diphosphate pyrophosphatase
VAVVDVGTNSTRLLVAEVADGRVTRELERRTTVTRLGEGVDKEGRLAEAAMKRVFEACAAYLKAIQEEREGGDGEAAEGGQPFPVVAILTSAARDAANGAEFQRALERRFGFVAQTISGEREAHLTYTGATAGRRPGQPTLVLDIGGGSTEVVVGHGQDIEFFVSTQLGSVRHTERHLHSDPPTFAEVAACRAATRAELERGVPEEIRERVRYGIAVAGTPTSFAAIDLQLDPYDPERVEGHRLTLAACERILGELAALPVDARRLVTGLHPDRAPTIVAGGAILVEAMRLFELAEIEVSERDILHGAALEAARNV